MFSVVVHYNDKLEVRMGRNAVLASGLIAVISHVTDDVHEGEIAIASRT